MICGPVDVESAHFNRPGMGCATRLTQEGAALFWVSIHRAKRPNGKRLVSLVGVGGLTGRSPCSVAVELMLPEAGIASLFRANKLLL